MARTVLIASILCLVAPMTSSAALILASIEPVSVPDAGSTLALLGMSFCGIAYVRSKLR